MRTGESVTFSYTGNIQTYEVESSGLYEIEVWGGQGGGGAGGGYAKGYKRLKRGTTLYIGVGGQGEASNPWTTHGAYTNAGGFNGGGSGRNAGWYDPDEDNYWTSYRGGYGGGGATHIALVDGVLSTIGYSDFVNNGKGIIIAGGGGGSANDQYRGTSYSGGSGGGTDGGGNSGGTPGASQSSGNAFGQGQNAPSQYRGGGGGGFYGGYAGSGDAPKVAGTGGSGWIGGVPSVEYKGETYAPSMSNGIRTGNGQAKLTKIGGAVVYYGELECTVALGETEIDDIYLGDVELG